MTDPGANRINAVGMMADDDQRVAARELTTVLRAVIERVVNTKAPADGLRAAAVELQRVAEVLDAHPRGRTYDFSESSIAGDPGAFFDNSPVAGLANPLAPPLKLRIEGDEVIGEVRWGSAYEGAPGLAQDLGGQPGMTGTLTTKFRTPTPLHTDLRFVARIDRIEGRKTFTTGELRDPDGNLLAEADAVFITVDMAKLKKLADDREKQTREG
jgi:hypothetical protein